MKKRILLSCLLISSFLVGCSNEETSSENTEEKVEIWVHMSKESAEGQVIQDTINQFNEEYQGQYTADIEFVPRSGGGGGYEDKINAAVSTGTLPDLLTLDGPNTAAYAESDIITPIDRYIEDEEDFYPSIIEQGTYEDNLYAIGYSESGVGIYYNKEMFEQAGIHEDEIATIEDPWTWNELMEVSERLQDEFDRPVMNMGLDDQSEWLMYAFTPFFWSNNGETISEEGNASGAFNKKESLETMRFLQTMLKEDYTTISPVEKGFLTGEYPMLMSGSWTIEELNTSYPDIEFGIMPYPVSPKTEKLVSPTGSWQYAMSETTDNEEGAGALLQYLTSTEAIADVSIGNSVLPARYSSADIVEQEASEPMKFLIEQNEISGQPRPVIPAYPQVSRAFQQTITGLEYYDADELDDLLDEKAQQMQTAIDRR